MMTAFAIRRLERLAALDKMAAAYKTRVGYVVAIAWLHIKKERRRAFWSSVFRAEKKANG
jgi:hypothetical protein